MPFKFRSLGSAVVFFLVCVSVMAGCFGGDDDSSSGDDDGSAADDALDDDASGDDSANDDTIAEHPCEGQWDVIVEGDYADDFDWVTTWTTKYVIAEDGATGGIVIPDAAGWETYDAEGVRTAPGEGWSEGSFSTPQDLVPYCSAETVQIRVDYAIDAGLFQGQATYHCPDELGPYTIFGQVVCGTP